MKKSINKHRWAKHERQDWSYSLFSTHKKVCRYKWKCRRCGTTTDFLNNKPSGLDTPDCKELMVSEIMGS